jgi:polysaccharide biosynthesis/export protein
MIGLRAYRLLYRLALAVWFLALAVGCGGPSYIWAKDVPPARAMPQVADERIRVGDGLAISVSGQPQLSGAFTVGLDGTIAIPDVGAVRVAGLRPHDATRMLTASIATIIQAPRVSVVVAQRRVQVAVLGEVQAPGKYLLAAGDGIVEAVATAGGLGEFANGNAIYLVRADEPVRIRFRMKDLLRGGLSARSFTLRDGDLIIVE